MTERLWKEDIPSCLQDEILKAAINIHKQAEFAAEELKEVVEKDRKRIAFAKAADNVREILKERFPQKVTIKDKLRRMIKNRRKVYEKKYFQ